MTIAMTPSLEPLERGRGLVFVLGPRRAGLGAVRAALETHPQVASARQSRFLVPLLSLWDVRCGSPSSPDDSGDAGAVMRHLTWQQFLPCARSFAARFYATRMRPGARCIVDQTWEYLPIAGVLPAMFPEARFLLVARDPCGILWSRLTVGAVPVADSGTHVEAIAADLRAMMDFRAGHADRTMLIRLETLLDEPGETIEAMLRFIGLSPEAAGEWRMEPSSRRMGHWSAPDGLPEHLRTQMHDAMDEGLLEAIDATRTMITVRCGGPGVVDAA